MTRYGLFSERANTINNSAILPYSIDGFYAGIGSNMGLFAVVV